MRWFVVFIISFLLLISVQGVVAEQNFNYVDLNNWDPVGDAATWEIVPGGRTVKQTANSDNPTFYISDQDYLNVAIRGTIKVENNGSDDDFIGFVLGFQENNSTYDFSIIEWGLNNRPVNDDMILGFFDGVDSTFSVKSSHEAYTSEYNSGSFNEYDRYQKGWEHDTEYEFEILYTETVIKVFIDGVQLLEETIPSETPFQSGRFGFYGSSQPNVIYGNIRLVDVDPTATRPVANADIYGTTNNSRLIVESSEGLFFNDYDPNLDAFEVNSFSQPNHGTLTLSTTSGAFSYQPNANFQGTDTFNYNLVEIGTDQALTSTSVTVSISVISGANIAPSNITINQLDNFSEYQNGTTLATVAAIDSNVGDFHDYLLVKNSDGRFGISGNQIILADENAIAFGESYLIEVMAVDFGGLSVSSEFEIVIPFKFESNWTFDLPNVLQTDLPLLKPNIEIIDDQYLISFSAIQSTSNGAVSIEYSINEGQDFEPYISPITVSTLTGIHYRGIDEFDNIRTITDVSLQPYRVYYVSDRFEELGYQDFYLVSQGGLDSSMLYDFEYHTFGEFYTDRFFIETRDLNENIVFAKMNRIFERVLTPTIGDQDFISLPVPSNLILTDRVISNGGVQYTSLSTEFVNVSGSNVEFNPANEHYYMGFKGDSVQKNWQDAKDFCEAKTGYLVTITDQDEWSWILETFGAKGNNFEDIWIGLTDENDEDTFTWITGEPNTWTNRVDPWAGDEPNNSGGNEDFVQARLTSTLKNWNDLNGTTSKNFICEFDITRSNIVDGNQAIQINDTYYNQNYVVTLNPEGGSLEHTTLTAAYASNLSNLPTPNRPGYQFKGWINDQDVSVNSIIIDSNQTYNAEWELKNYPITYITANFGNLTPSQITFTIEDSVTLETPTAISGYAFEGWYETETFVSGTSVTSIALGTTDSVTVYAKFEPIIYTITLDVSGGNSEDPITQPYGSEIRLPAAKRPGYTLQGWYDGQERIPYNTRVKLGDRTYVAQWKPNLYTLTMTNTANDETSTITAAYESPIVVPIYKLEGYTFRGWFEGGTNVNFSSMPLGDRTIRAIMEPNPYTITFNTGEAPAIPALEAPYQSPIQLPTPTLENHTFDGWMLNGEVVNLTEMPLNGATLTASFTKLESTITFVNPDGNAPAPITTLIGEAITLPTASKSGHTFEGWFLDGTQVSLTTMPELPITLTARFTINQYTLNVNGFNGQRIRQITADYGQTVTLTVPEQLGYLFAGWTLNGQAISGNQLSMPAGGGTVNALFDPILYPVSWVYKDEIIQMRLPFESVIPLPVSNVTGYAFEGWQQDGSFIETATVPLRGTTVTAIYRAYQTIQTFYLPDQTASITLITDELFNGPTLNIPDGLVFGGYTTEPFGLGETLSSTDRIENGLDARVYPYIYNPESVDQMPSSQTLFTGSSRRTSDSASPIEPSRPAAIPWLSVIAWGGSILTLAILAERGKRRG